MPFLHCYYCMFHCTKSVREVHKHRVVTDPPSLTWIGELPRILFSSNTFSLQRKKLNGSQFLLLGFIFNSNEMHRHCQCVVRFSKNWVWSEFGSALVTTVTMVRCVTNSYRLPVEPQRSQREVGLIPSFSQSWTFLLYYYNTNTVPRSRTNLILFLGQNIKLRMHPRVLWGFYVKFKMYIIQPHFRK